MKEYKERLRVALLTYNRADVYSRQRKHKTTHKLMNQADKLFECLLERLQEITRADPSLAAWRRTGWQAAFDTVSAAWPGFGRIKIW